MRKYLCIIFVIHLFGNSLLNGQSKETSIDSLFTWGDKWVYQNIDSAHFFYHQIEAKLATSDSFEKAELFKRYGIIQRILGKYEKATQSYLSALNIYNDLKDSTNIAEIRHNLGFLMRQIKNYDQAIIEFERAIAIRKLIGDSTLIGNSIRELGVIYRKKKNLSKADSLYGIAENYYTDNTDIKEKLRLSGNFATLYSIQKKYDEAIDIDKRAIGILKNLDNPEAIITRYVNIAFAYRKKKKFEKAHSYCDTAFDLATANNLLKVKTNASYHRSKIYASQKNYKQAYSWHRKFKKLNDSLFNIQKLRSVNESLTSTRYEDAIFRDSIKNLMIQSELQQKIKKQKNQFWGILFGSIILLLLLYLTWRNLSHKKQLIEEQSKNSKLKHQLLENQLQKQKEKVDMFIKESETRIEMKKSLIKKIQHIVNQDYKDNRQMFELLHTLENDFRLQQEAHTITKKNR